MSAETVCIHNKFGYCKHGDHCWKRHVQETCRNQECDTTRCDKRHPRQCSYYRDYRRCKFGEYCAFDHSNPTDPVLEELKLVKARLKDVEKDIETKSAEIKCILERFENALKCLNENSKTSVPIISPAKVTSPPCMSAPQSNITMVTYNPANICQTNISPGNRIPQLDGHILDVSTVYPNPLPSNKCDNCGKNCESIVELENHNEEHQYGCDDCYLCFTSKYIADLHELEMHPGTTYARDHIPDTTKIQFAAGHRQR